LIIGWHVLSATSTSIIVHVESRLKHGNLLHYAALCHLVLFSQWLDWTSKWWLKMNGLNLAYFDFVSLVWKWFLWNTEFYPCCYLFSRASLIIHTMFQLRTSWLKSFRTLHWWIISGFGPIIICLLSCTPFYKKITSDNNQIKLKILLF